ncbi:MAG: type II toxin-antitoxin system VapC family toxin [Dehalococcoidia bacterium]|nr:type II toxin-antitoxin system VapC family toxin [Dehalococcoidia bacterium]MYD27659.1 type II toxin-antitoxin system VapC family toxin [Dehalococcoidia bacterium]
MIVADASVVVEMLLNRDAQAGVALGMRIEGDEEVCAPHLLEAEVAQVLRRMVLRRQMSASRARASLGPLVNLPIRRYPHGWLLPRAFELRDNVTIYDGLYLALAEALDVPVLTCDSALAGVPGCDATVELLPATG